MIFFDEDDLRAQEKKKKKKKKKSQAFLRHEMEAPGSIEYEPQIVDEDEIEKRLILQAYENFDLAKNSTNPVEDISNQIKKITDIDLSHVSTLKPAQDLSPPRRSNVTNRNDNQDLSPERRKPSASSASSKEHKHRHHESRSSRHRHHRSHQRHHKHRSRKNSRSTSKDSVDKMYEKQYKLEGSKRSHSHEAAKHSKKKKTLNEEKHKVSFRREELSSEGSGTESEEIASNSSNTSEADDDDSSTERGTFNEEDYKIIGKGQKAVVRDEKTGKVVGDVETTVKKEREKEERMKQIKEMLNRGKVQMQQEKEKEKRLEELKYAPFARSLNDKEYLDEMEQEIIDDDPMKDYFAEKEEKKRKGKSSSKHKKNRSGESAEEHPSDSLSSSSSSSIKPKYTGPPAPPNRFGILPGHLWDGRDRSNGFEARLFEAKSERALKNQKLLMGSMIDF